MQTQYQTLKGFRDFLPADALKRQWLREKIISVFERWGYDPLETPTLEPLALFAGQIGEDEKLFFKFEDNGGRQVALRYDQTVPTCRVVGQYYQTLPMPFRRYQIQSAYRAEKPQAGRYREFVQCDADIFGIEGPIADAEVIALGLAIYKELGFKKVIAKINNRALLKDMPYEAIVAIDKLAKIGKDGVVADMVAKGIAEKTAKGYLETVLNLKPDETIKTILTYLEAQGFPKGWYEFDPTIARSFSYSTGPIWEIVVPDVPGGSVLGGERFDKLVEKIAGITVPATGFGLGFDRTLEAAEALGLIPTLKTNTQALVTIFSPDLQGVTLKVAAKLRESGINTELYPDNQTKLEKQMKYADKKGIPFVVIIGEDEAKNNVVTLKNLSNREQSTMSLDQCEIMIKQT